MNGVVQRICERDPYLSLIADREFTTFYQKDIVDMWGDNPYTLFVEEGMFFYGIVRLLKPEAVLETGTNLGLSTRFMALAMEDNGKGKLITVEHDRTVYETVCKKLEPYPNAHPLRANAMDLDLGDRKFDMMFLDTEFITRFREMEKYWGNVTPGGVVFVHDCLSVDCKRFHGAPEVEWAAKVHLVSPHGMLMFQKGGVDYEATYG